ncbi:MAG: hypothetical protein ACODAD_02450 [Planctomycetota bacterium]
MTQTSSENHDRPEYDLDPDIEFHGQPQALALITLALGLLSFLACFNTMFWGLPILALVLGPISLFTLARSPDKIGRKAALAGMLLAILFGSSTISRHVSRRLWVSEHARRYANLWLQRIQENKLKEAHQLHLPQAHRAATGGSLDKHYREQQPLQEELEGFYGSAPLKTFIEVAPRAKIEFVGQIGYQPAVSQDDVVLRYVARYQQNGESKELAMDLIMRRKAQFEQGISSWYLLNVREVDGAP